MQAQHQHGLLAASLSVHLPEPPTLVSPDDALGRSRARRRDCLIALPVRLVTTAAADSPADICEPLTGSAEEALEIPTPSIRRLYLARQRREGAQIRELALAASARRLGLPVVVDG